MTNTLYYGDNLSVIRNNLADESVDLIYLDPPFNSNANYNVLFKSVEGSQSQAQIEAFDDTWHWSILSEEAFDEVIHSGNIKAAEVLRTMRSFLGDNDMMAYLAMMAVRLIELHRVLKETGSLYLHCDPTASHYLKLILDAVFGWENYRNEITWKRTHAHNDPKRFGRNADIIFFYTKSKHYFFKPVYCEYSEEYINNFFRYEDERGRYRLVILTGPKVSSGASNTLWSGYRPSQSKRSWSVPKRIVNQLVGEKKARSMSIVERLDLLNEHDYIVFSKNGIPSFKQYLDDMQGVAAQAIWHDISPISAQSKERLGYPTQKPLALLERIVEASSKKGDVVLDPFCGCGTALDAAQKMKRQWIGIDITHLAISLIERRLQKRYGKKLDYEVLGVPKTIEGARDLALRDKFQFEWWALSLVDAQPAGGKKKGADKGIDGIIYFKSDSKKTQRAIVSVKGGKNVGVSMIRDLKGVLEREQAPIGVFITLEPPTQPMLKEAAAAGFYETDFSGKCPKLQIITIEALFNGDKPRIPLVDMSVAFKDADLHEDVEQRQMDL